MQMNMISVPFAPLTSLSEKLGVEAVSPEKLDKVQTLLSTAEIYTIDKEFADAAADLIIDS